LSSNSLVTAEHDRGSDDGFATRIGNFSPDRDVLGEGFRPGNHQQPCKEKAANGVEDFHKIEVIRIDGVDFLRLVLPVFAKLVIFAVGIADK
jgi:hypothetical protein